MPSLFHSSDHVTLLISLTVLAILILLIGIFMYHDDDIPINVGHISPSGLPFKDGEISYINRTVIPVPSEVPVVLDTISERRGGKRYYIK